MSLDGAAPGAGVALEDVADLEDAVAPEEERAEPPGALVSELARPVVGAPEGVAAEVGGDVDGVSAPFEVSPPARAALLRAESRAAAPAEVLPCARAWSSRSRRTCGVVPSDSLTPNSLRIRSGVAPASSSGRTSSTDRSEISAPRGLVTVPAINLPQASVRSHHHTAR